MVVKNHLLDEYHIIRDQASHLAFEEKRWELIKTSRQGVKVLKLPAYQNKFGHTVFRAECLVPGNLERVFDMIHPSTQYYRSHWDKIAQSIDVIEEINERVFLVRVLPEPMLKGIIALRDSLDICGFEETDDTKFLAMGSVIDSDHPNVKGYVRVWTYPSGIFCRTTDNPEITSVVGIFHADMKSYVPTSMLDAAFPFLIIQYYEALQNTDTLEYTPLVDVPGKRQVKQH